MWYKCLINVDLQILLRFCRKQNNSNIFPISLFWTAPIKIKLTKKKLAAFVFSEWWCLLKRKHKKSTRNFTYDITFWIEPIIISSYVFVYIMINHKLWVCYTNEFYFNIKHMNSVPHKTTSKEKKSQKMILISEWRKLCFWLSYNACKIMSKNRK